MNYLYIFNKNIVDYSDGSHGIHDQNDWEHFYLPFFQIENNIICEPGILPPAKERVVNENITIVIDGWDYSEKLTKQFTEEYSTWSPVDPIKCNWSVYVKTEENSISSTRPIRIYAKPLVPISGWSLIKEGYIDTEGTMWLY